VKGNSRSDPGLQRGGERCKPSGHGRLKQSRSGAAEWSMLQRQMSVTFMSDRIYYGNEGGTAYNAPLPCAGKGRIFNLSGL